jgi:hypothetical protein
MVNGCQIIFYIKKGVIWTVACSLAREKTYTPSINRVNQKQTMPELTAVDFAFISLTV